MAPAKPHDRSLVVLVPGILEPPMALWTLAWRLRKRGFEPSVFAYRSTRARIEEHAERLHTYLERRTHQFSRPFSLVGHSMGGLVIRAWLAPRAGAGLGVERVVFLGTPHRGAQLAERLGDRGWFRLLFGSTAARQLRPCDPFILATPAPSVPFGTIAGGTGGAIGRAGWIPEDNDRIVEVSSTHLDGESDWLRIDADHQGMIHRRDTALAVVNFLKTGRFRTSTAQSPPR